MDEFLDAQAAWIILEIHGAVAESADATDLKSVDGDIVRVRPPPAPQEEEIHFYAHGCLFIRRDPLMFLLIGERFNILVISTGLLKIQLIKLRYKNFDLQNLKLNILYNY